MNSSILYKKTLNAADYKFHLNRLREELNRRKSLLKTEQLQ